MLAAASVNCLLYLNIGYNFALPIEEIDMGSKPDRSRTVGSSNNVFIHKLNEAPLVTHKICL